MKSRLTKKASGIALASSLVAIGLLPAAAAFAASMPSVSLSASSLTAQPGGSVTFTASSSGVSNPEYQFWVEQPNGQWTVAQNWSTSNTFTLNNVTTGDYLVTAYVLGQQQLQNHDWSAATNAEANGQQAVDGVFVDSSVSVSSSSATVTEGQTVTVTADASNIYSPLYQFWYKDPSGNWHQSGDYTANSTFTFTANQTGTYEIVAYAKSPLALNNPEGALMSNAASVTSAVGQPTIGNIQISGQSAGTGTSGSPALVTNGGSLTLSTTLLDAMGNPVPNVAITYDISGVTAGALPSVMSNGQVVSGTASTSSSGTYEYTVYTNSEGTASIQVSGPSGSTVSYTVQAVAPYQVNGNSLETPSAYVEFVTAGQVGISPLATSTAPYVGTLGQAIPVTVTVPPVNGVAQANVPVEFSDTATGLNGYFTNAAGSENFGLTQTVYTNAEGQATVYVIDPVAGDENTITASLTYNGAQVTESTYLEFQQAGIPTSIANLTVSNSNPSAGQQVTISGTVEDATGNPVPNVTVLVAAAAGSSTGNPNGYAEYELNGKATAFPNVNAGTLYDTTTNTGVPATSTYGAVLTTNASGQFSITVTDSQQETDTYYVYLTQNGYVDATPISQKLTYGASTSLSGIGLFATSAAASSATSASNLTGVQTTDTSPVTVYVAPFTSTGLDAGQSITYQLSASNGGLIDSINGTALTSPVSSVTLSETYSSTSGYTLTIPGELDKTASSPIFSVGVSNSTTGNTVLTVSSGSVSGTATIDVTAGPATNVTNFPAVVQLNAGSFQTLSYQVLDQAGNPVPNAASTLYYDGSQNNLWITQVNGVTLQQSLPVGSSNANEPTPIPLYSVSGLGYSSVSIPDVVSWNSGKNTVTVYSNNSGNVSLTLQAGPVTYYTSSSSPYVTSTTSASPSAPTYVYTYPDASQTQASNGAVYLGTTGPSGYSNIGQINW
ncbi:hypothetical protein TPY_1415 [Sulfobacillus acidophilus TPY]|nr:hypothetical protein TPY_1415 [Sulfobacillus acidophilus TPY]